APGRPRGGVSASLRLSVARSNGLCGATQGAKSAAPTQAKSSSAETTATGEWRNPYARSLPHQRPSRPGRAAVVTVGAATGATRAAAISPHHDPLQEVEVVGQLHQVDVLLHRPRQGLLMQRYMADVVRVNLVELVDHRLALLLIELARDLRPQLVDALVRIAAEVELPLTGGAGRHENGEDLVVGVVRGRRPAEHIERRVARQDL